MIGTFSDFADQSILIPVEILVFLSLTLSGRRRDATSWGLAMLAGSTLIVILKLWFERCGIPSHRVLYSPSGHSMGGTMVYGGLLALLCRRTWVFAAGTILLAVAFAWSRVALGVHTTCEVITGSVVGLAVVCLLRFALNGKDMAGPRMNVPVTLALICAVAFGLHGYRLGAEAWIQTAARHVFGPFFCRK
ncbi:phosphatase PAP2 family protein [Acetobacter musti]|uniref:Phosphatase PAP2 family protein n=1 Tax=Acetobacter musti TaxID=864732 RepID=A0ABX0JLG9_9PROT|nr:phosphatase PAP2 family protein [Acetobacter musti]NHN83593.1 phosphatase PAP2 family protein [Acetobacter musti]